MQKKLECPTCYQFSMIQKRGSSKLSDGFLVKNINRWVCTNCGEELYDPQAMKAIRKQREVEMSAV